MIALAWKHANVFIDTSAYLPRYYPPQLIHFLKTYGRDKVLFATNFPMLGFEKCSPIRRKASWGSSRPSRHASSATTPGLCSDSNSVTAVMPGLVPRPSASATSVNLGKPCRLYRSCRSWKG